MKDMKAPKRTSAPHGKFHGKIAVMNKKPLHANMFEKDPVLSGKEDSPLFKTVYDQAGDAITIHDFDGRFIEVNQELCDQVGYRKDQILQMTVMDLDTPENASQARERIDKVRKHGTLVFETEHIDSKGTTVPLEVVSKYIVVDGKPAILNIERDITRRKAAEEALLKSKEFYQDIMENSSDFIMMISPDFRLAYANRSLRKRLGYTEDEMKGLSMMDIIHPSKIGTCTEKFKKIVSGEDVGFIETLFATSTGEKVYVEGLCNCKFIEEGFVSIRSIFRDTTAQKKLQEESQQAQKLEAIGILAGGMAHDFNNLLAGLAGVISVVKSSLSPDDDRYQVLTEALDSCMSGKEITSKFITFAEGDSPFKSIIKIDNVLKETVKAASSSFQVQCDFILADDLWQVEVDKSQFQQLVRNITINGCESMSDNGALTVTTENVLIEKGDDPLLQEGRYIRIAIRDQGTGIPEENLNKIFLPYFTTKNKTNIKGSGLGLAVCSSIIKKHKGKISVDTTDNDGTTFNIYLPAFSIA